MITIQTLNYPFANSIIVNSKGDIYDYGKDIPHLLGYAESRLLKMNITDIIESEILNDFIKNENLQHKEAGAYFRGITANTGNDKTVKLYINFNDFYKKEERFININLFTKNSLKNRLLNEIEVSKLFDNITDCIIVTDKDRRVLFINKSAENLYEMESEEIVGEYVESAIKTDADGIDLKKAQSELDIDGFHRNVYVQYSKSGKKLFVEGTVIPLKKYDGQLIGYFALNRDLTELKEKEEEIFFRSSLLQHVNISVIAVDFNGSITFFNKESENLFGWTEEEANGNNIFDLIIPRNKNTELKKILKEVNNKQFWDGEILAKRKDSVRFHAHFRISILRNHLNDSSGYIFLLNDITERKKAEDELKESQKQLRDLAARLDFVREEERKYIAREIHDELGQLLTALKMDVSLLTKKILKYLGKTAQIQVRSEIRSITELIDISVSSVRRLASELRSDLLFDLGLKEALEWYLEDFEKRTGIICTFSAKLDTKNKINSSVSLALFRICQEALTNILRHSGAAEVNVTLESADGKTILSVFDNGNGFSKLKLKNKKTLGIIGMRERALSLGGSVNIKSSIGKGTTVTACIPY